MLRIGICDDQEAELRETERWCRSYLEEHGIKGEIFTALHWELLSGKELDLLFLDVEMPNKDGISIKDELEEGTRPLILFVTSYEEYMPHAFGKNVIGFIQKPIGDFDFNLSMEKGIRLLTAGKVVELDGEHVSTEHISMFTTDNRYTKAVLESGEERKFLVKSLSAWEKEVEEVYFLRVTNSDLINCKFIYSFTGDKVKMKDGQELKVSKRRRKACYDKFIEYIRRFGKHV